MIRLTQTVQKGGCAAKIAAAELRKILSKVQFPPKDSNVLVDGSQFDDAAIYEVNEELALVQTLDFFTPILDTPYLFGKVAAANALSDVYAMGGEPKTALAILAFPLATMDAEVIEQVLQGACDVMKESGVSLVGGHSIDDDTLKFGLSVSGYVHPDRIWTNAGAKVGDHLILTKPLGTGTLTAGLKRDAWGEDSIMDAIQSMSQINRILDLLTDDEASHIHAATDITGFGLAGHAMQMAKASRTSLQFDFQKIPRFQKAMGAVQEGFLTKAHRTNKEYTKPSCQYSTITEHESQLLFDPQTSGGLLLSLSREHSALILKKLRTRFAHAEVIGQVVEKNEFDWSIL